MPVNVLYDISEQMSLISVNNIFIMLFGIKLQDMNTHVLLSIHIYYIFVHAGESLICMTVFGFWTGFCLSS